MGMGTSSELNTIDKAFNNWMTEVFQGSSLDEVINEVFTHMRKQIKNQHW